MKELYLIGIGPGGEKQRTLEVIDAINDSEVLIGSRRIMDSLKDFGKPCMISWNYDEIYRFIKEQDFQKFGLVFSGDIGFYSGAKDYFKSSEFKIHYVSGVSSITYFLNKVGVPWDSVKLISHHGVDTNYMYYFTHNQYTALLGGDPYLLQEIMRKCVQYKLMGYRIFVGEDLTLPTEKITEYYQNFKEDQSFPKISSLSIILFYNPIPSTVITGGIQDEKFRRDNTKVPMTKYQIRRAIISALRLTANSVIYDIGCGTGSISIESALLAHEGRVYGFDINPEAVKQTNLNKELFVTDNLIISEGKAPDCFSDYLQQPTHAFIGGSSGNIEDIVEALIKLNPYVRIVMSAISLQTISKLSEIISKYKDDYDYEVVCLNIANNKVLGSEGWDLMIGENPVYILSMEMKE